MSDIVERLRSSEPLPACPYDKLSPHYMNAPHDKPCTVCGGLNDPDAPDLCRGADTRIMGEAADEIERLTKLCKEQGQEVAITRARDEALVAERDALRVEAADAKDDALRLHRDKMQLFDENIVLRALLTRYRNETPLGNQPHMIAHEVDDALSPAAHQREGAK